MKTNSGISLPLSLKVILINSLKKGLLIKSDWGGGEGGNTKIMTYVHYITWQISKMAINVSYISAQAFAM